MLRNLPYEIREIIYSFDNTSKENYNNVIRKIKLLPTFLYQQEIWSDISSYKYRYVFICNKESNKESIIMKTIDCTNIVSYLNLLKTVMEISTKNIGKYNIMLTKIYQA